MIDRATLADIAPPLNDARVCVEIALKRLGTDHPDVRERLEAALATLHAVAEGRCGH